MEAEKQTSLGPPRTDQEYEVVKTVDFYRGLIMDLLEFKLKERKDWTEIRRQMLKLLGNNGLEQKLRSIVTETGGRNGNR